MNGWSLIMAKIIVNQSNELLNKPTGNISSKIKALINRQVSSLYTNISLCAAA